MSTERQPHKPTVMAFATLPPPVHGASVATERFIAMTESALDWRIHSVGRPSQSAFSGQLTRLFRNLRAGAACLTTSKSELQCCYMPISAGITMIYNLGYAAACAVRRVPILIHHHSYSYINRSSRLMALLNRFLSEKDGQVFLSDTMRAGFDRQYKRRSQAVVLPNSYAMALNHSLDLSEENRSRTYRIGHFCNLSIEKGLQTVLETFAPLYEKEKNFELHLGGPVMGPREQALLEKARSDFGDAVKIYGPLYGADKDRFFRSIDTFWFPSEYVNEAQPIVLVEAIAFGVPCISMKRGCIEWLLGDAGVAATDRQQFTQIAIERAMFHSSDAEQTTARAHCRNRFNQLRELESVGFSDAIRFLSRS